MGIRLGLAMVSAVVLLASLVGGGFVAADAGGVFVDGVAASAKLKNAEEQERARRDFLLWSDVELVARLELLGRSRGALPLGPKPLGKKIAWHDVRARVLNQRLIALEAIASGLEDVADADELAAERRELEEKAGGKARLNAFLKAFEVGRDEFDDLIAERVRVRAFLRANLREPPPLSEKTLRAAFEKEAHPFIGSAFEDVREAFVVWFDQLRRQRALARFMKAVAAKYRVQLGKLPS